MNFPQSLLWPLSLPYATVATIRARAYKAGFLRQRRLAGKVISVGNLTVGGTGKTPMVAWIAERLLKEGKRIGILSRGYKGELAGNSAENTSDEARLLKARLGQRVAFGIGADRYANGQRLAQQGIEWFVLDDGFQHLQLARDVDIVLIDATNPFGGGVLPAGRLREPRSALRRAHIVVITRSGHAPALETIIRRYTDAPIFYAQAQLERMRVWRGSYPRETEPQTQPKKLFAFCGIGNPKAFTTNLREWGFDVVDQRFFRDHHRYTQQDADEMRQAARAAGAEGLICTEKDTFNLDSVQFGEFEVRYCTITMQIENADLFWSEIMKRTKT